MGKALMVTRDQSGAGLISADFNNFFGNQTRNTSETNSRATATEAMTFSKLRGNVYSGGSGTNSFRFRKNAADGNQLGTAVGAVTYEDASNTDVLAANDTFGVAYTDTGTDSLGWMACNVEFASGHGNLHGSANWGGSSIVTASSTTFWPLSGNMNGGGTTESNAQWKNRAYTSWEALQVRVPSNARTNTTSYRNRINGAFGTLQVDFAAGVTGTVVDTGPADALADGDLICVSTETLTGTEAIFTSFVLGTFKSTSNKSQIWAGSTGSASRTASATEHFITIGGGIKGIDTSPTEVACRCKVGFEAIVSHLACNVTANTCTGTVTVRVLKNGTQLLTLAIGAGATGIIENTVDTGEINNTDSLSIGIAGGTSGSITFRGLGVTFSPLAPVTSGLHESVWFSGVPHYPSVIMGR